MKLLITLLVLVGALCAMASEDGLGAPLQEIYTQMICERAQIDQLTMEYDCESIWDQYRPEFLNAVGDFEDCATITDTFEADKCRYFNYECSEATISQFYMELRAVNELCYRLIPTDVQNMCEYKEERHIRVDPLS